MESMTSEFVISRPPVQLRPPAPIQSTTYGRSVARVISSTVVAFVLLCAPENLYAQESGNAGFVIPASVFAGLQALDVHSTHRAITSGHGREGNPWMQFSTGEQAAIKAGVAAGVITAAALVHRKSPRAAKVTLWILNGAMVAVVANNYAIASGRRR